MTHLDPPIEYCALQYAEFWFRTERGVREDLASRDRARRLDGLAQGAAYFKIARTLPRAGDVDVGMERYAPVLDVISQPENNVPDGQVMVDVVIRVRDELREVYGRAPLSATTKFLWLVHRDPFVIFDSQARKRLGTAEGAYTEFVDRWEQSYESMADAIRRACVALPDMRCYLSRGNALMDKDVQSVVTEEWFCRRVHDVLLWEAGARMP